MRICRHLLRGLLQLLRCCELRQVEQINAVQGSLQSVPFCMLMCSSSSTCMHAGTSSGTGCSWHLRRAELKLAAL